MPKLPIQLTDDLSLSLMQTKWASIINPFLGNPSNSALIIPNVALVTGSNTINHKLGQKLQGWVVIGNNASTTFYDSQASNQQPDLTLVLVASGACTVSLLVF